MHFFALYIAFSKKNICKIPHLLGLLMEDYGCIFAAKLRKDMKKVFALLLGVCFVSYAQAEEIDTLRVVDIEEVTIVASPKETGKLRQMPIGVTLLSQQQLKDAHVNDVKGLTSVVPNLFIPDYGSRLTSAMYIRGIGSRINTPAVGLYVDNVPYIDKSAFDFNYADVERIDVLRGPQSTLYGRNTMGGLIKVHTKSPFSYQGTDLQLGAGSHNQYRASLTHYHRISPQFAFSAGGFYDYEGGFFKNAALQDEKIDHSQQAGGRIRAIWFPAEDWKIDLSTNYEYSDQGGYPYGIYDKQKDEVAQPAYNRESSYRRHLLNVGLNLEHQADAFILSAVTGYQHLNDRMFMDQDFTPADIFTLEQRQRINTISEEIVLKSKPGRRWQWTTGAFAFYQDLHTTAPVTFRKDGIAMLGQNIGKFMPEKIEVGMGPTMAMHILPTLALDSQEMPIDGCFDTPMANAALFHQSTFNDLFGIDGLSLTAGLRIDYEKMKIDYNTGTALDYNVGIKGEMYMNGNLVRPIEMMPATALKVESRYDDAMSKDYWQVLPKVAVQYNLPNNVGNIYASVSKGYRSGGYNIQLFSDLLQSSLRNDMMRQTKEEVLSKVPEAYAGMVAGYFPDASANPDEKNTIEFKPETTWSYEVGTHLNLLDNRLHIDGALFLMETKDQQISRMLLSGLGRETVNAGESRSLGLELGIIAALTNALQVNASYGYTYATFRYWELGNKVDSSEMAIDYTGNYVPFVPKHTLNLGAQYAIGLPGRMIERIVLSANYAGAGRIYWDEQNSVSQALYGTLNGRISLQHKDCELSFWVRNALNEEYDVFYFTSMNNGLKQLGRPVHGGVEVRIRL